MMMSAGVHAKFKSITAMHLNLLFFILIPPAELHPYSKFNQSVFDSCIDHFMIFFAYGINTKLCLVFLELSAYSGLGSAARRTGDRTTKCIPLNACIRGN